MPLNLTFERVRKKAPQIVLVTAAVAVAVVVLLEILEDVFLEGAPITGGPLQGLLSSIVLLTRNVTAAISSWGYPGVFVLMLLESSSLPIPSEVVLPFAGYLVSTWQLNFWVCVVIATVAGVAGSLVDYYLGLKGAHVLVEHKIFGKTFFTKGHLETAVNWFNKYGVAVVFFSRLIPGFRTIVSFPAGAVRMSLWKFVTFTTFGCLIWNAILIYVGVFLGQNWGRVAGLLHYLIIAAAIALIVVGLLVAFRLMGRSRPIQSTKPE